VKIAAMHCPSSR